MERYMYIDEKVQQILSKIYLDSLKSYAYSHLYGCVMMITQLAIERNLNIELARIAALLHDIATFSENCGHKVHAQRSAIIASEILIESNLFSTEEIQCISTMIQCHSNKNQIHDEMCELLKDADILTSYYHNLINDGSKRLHELLNNKNQMG